MSELPILREQHAIGGRGGLAAGPIGRADKLVKPVALLGSAAQRAAAAELRTSQRSIGMTRRSVTRSAGSGKFVSPRTAARHPRTTVTQTVGGHSKGHRSTITGRCVKPATAKRHPNTTIHEG